MSITTTEDRKGAVRESNLREWNEGEIDEDLYGEEYVLHDPLGDHNFADVTKMIEAVRSGTSDFQFRVDDLIGEGDRVVLRYTMTGRNTGASYLTEEPTGKSWEASGISIYRFEGEQIVEQWDNFDYFGVMKQLGLISTEPAASRS
ncbi:ester cyclase [Halobellus rufus]|uniref:ester cyclase n=1 Tax=Halobellus rufus TaxID=1448860 RepID=UPI00067998B5|nr:ester cyclase [Halobellus rufus]